MAAVLPTVHLCNPFQETHLSSLAASQAPLAEGGQAVTPLLTPSLPHRCMGGNILLHLKKSARKSEFLLWGTYNHNKPNNFPPSFPGNQNTYGNSDLLQIFFQENDIVTKIFLMARMAAGFLLVVMVVFLKISVYNTKLMLLYFPPAQKILVRRECSVRSSAILLS